jgi:hypothetical protein
MARKRLDGRRRPHRRATLASRSGRREGSRPPLQELVPIRVQVIDWWRLLFPRRCVNYNRQDQQQTNWCWAGVSAAVAAFYDPATPWSQCAIANAELGRTDCCGVGASGACNVAWYLNQALTRVGHLAAFSGGTLTFGVVQSEINAGRPVCARIGWSGGGGHFVALTCWYRNLLSGSQIVRVDDPWPAYGRSTWVFATFSTAYQGSGSWTHSYRTA